MTSVAKYTINDFNNIILNGFNYELSAQTLATINEISKSVGYHDTIYNPIFKKRENPLLTDNVVISEFNNSSNSINNGGSIRKRKGNKAMEINDDDWENMRSFHTTKIESKTGIDSQIDQIRLHINKITDKNYKDLRDKIIIIIEAMINTNIDKDDMNRVSGVLFDIASNNRFYSKNYADLLSDLSKQFTIISSTIQNNLDKFTDLFNNIEYVDPNVNYDKFCEINKLNEKRKALSAFYINLMNNGIIKQEQIKFITRNLLQQIYDFVSVENKKNEVDELAENVALLYKKELYEDDEADDYDEIDGHTITEIIEKLANSKVKDYKSLTNKTIFKFMDLVEN